jgi:hypothetical protein
MSQKKSQILALFWAFFKSFIDLKCFWWYNFPPNLLFLEIRPRTIGGGQLKTRTEKGGGLSWALLKTSLT